MTRVPLTLLMRLLREVTGDCRLEAEVMTPDNVLSPMLRMAEERSPSGPRPSKLMSREKTNPPAVPSKTNAPPW